jgi:hypothetical protein
MSSTGKGKKRGREDDDDEETTPRPHKKPAAAAAVASPPAATTGASATQVGSLLDLMSSPCNGDGRAPTLMRRMTCGVDERCLIMWCGAVGRVLKTFLFHPQSGRKRGAAKKGKGKKRISGTCALPRCGSAFVGSTKSSWISGFRQGYTFIGCHSCE